MNRALLSPMLRRCLVIALSLVMTIACSACNPQRFKTATARVPQLIYAQPSSPSTFNVALNQSLFSLVVFGYLYEGLLITDGAGELEPALAESLPEISPDKRRLIFTLKPGLKWSDGQPLTIEDVIFSFQDIYLNEKIPSDVKDVLRVGQSRALPTVKKIDDRRVEFTVPEPFAPLLRNIGGMSILPAHMMRESVQKTDANGQLLFLSMWGTDTDPQKMVGSGLYRLEKYVPNQRLIFRRNPYYWRKDAQGNPQPYIERVVVQAIESTDTQLLNFRSGQLDSLEVTPEAFPLLKHEEERGKFTIYNAGPETITLFVSFNLNKARNAKNQPLVDPIKSRWFNTLAFRQAVAYAIDRDTMKTNIFRGLGDLQNSSFSPNGPYRLSPEAGLKVYDYNPEKSKQLLLGAGFHYNSQGQLLDNQGNRVKFELLVKSEEKTRVDMAVQIQQNLKQIGIETNLQVLNFNSIKKKLDSRNWECYVGGFGGGGVEPNSGANIWTSKGRLHQFNLGPQVGDQQPIQGWEASEWEQEIDQLLIAGVRELEEAKRKPIYAKLQQIAQEQVPFIYLVNKLSLEAVRDRIQGIQFSPLSGAFWNLYELKVLD